MGRFGSGRLGSGGERFQRYAGFMRRSPHSRTCWSAWWWRPANC